MIFLKMLLCLNQHFNEYIKVSGLLRRILYYTGYILRVITKDIIAL